MPWAAYRPNHGCHGKSCPTSSRKAGCGGCPPIHRKGTSRRGVGAEVFGFLQVGRGPIQHAMAQSVNVHVVQGCTTHLVAHHVLNEDVLARKAPVRGYRNSLWSSRSCAARLAAGRSVAGVARGDQYEHRHPHGYFVGRIAVCQSVVQLRTSSNSEPIRPSPKLCARSPPLSHRSPSATTSAPWSVRSAACPYS